MLPPVVHKIIESLGEYSRNFNFHFADSCASVRSE
jgi:hypothetical protein